MGFGAEFLEREGGKMNQENRRKIMLLTCVLLFLCIPGCYLLGGPKELRGIVGESLRVQCRYEEEHRMSGKYWCRRGYWLACSKIVETRGSGEEVTIGRMSIRDDPRDLTFFVTMKHLVEDDSGSYACGINTTRKDPKFWIMVLVSKASATNVIKSTPKGSRGAPDSPLRTYSKKTPAPIPLSSLQKEGGWSTERVRRTRARL
uniref:Immunoglobulin V-set domain-containing protein n=1 Tax=Ornithorhynchus anatinus TaxID=9258 RepID=A0A6I8N6F6_ORNAN